MLGKRRRDSLSSDPDLSTSLPLTKRNLVEFERAMSGSQNGPKTPSKSISRKSALKSASGSVLDGTVVTDLSGKSNASYVLETWRIYARRKKMMPTNLHALIERVCAERSGNFTPKTRRIAQINDITRSMKEDDAIQVLEELLAFRGEIQTEGEEYVYGGHNHQWRAYAPRPTTNVSPEEEAALEAAMAAVGAPSRPKPDITYGYTTSTFTRSEMDGIRSLSDTERTQMEAPWFPFLLYEWKSSRTGGTDDAALLQARRDGATAVSANWNFFKSCGNPCPKEDLTCVFSACVTSSTVEIFAHWRNVDSGGDVAWESDSIGCGLLGKERDVFEIRGIILNILDWARGLRLESIRNALTVRRRNIVATRTAPIDVLQLPACEKSPIEPAPEQAPMQSFINTTDPFLPLSPPTTTSPGCRSPARKRSRVGSVSFTPS